MKINRILPWCVVLLISTTLIVGCSRGPTEEELAMQKLQTQYAGLQEAQAALELARQELEVTTTAKVEIEGIRANRRSDEQKQQLEALIEQERTQAEAVGTAYDTYQALLADFLTFALNDLPDDPTTLEGLNLYADESIVNADETIAKAGDYKKALDLLDSASNYYEMIGKEVYQPLVDKKEELDDARYITKERFDQIKRNMSEDQVKEIAGVPYYRNIHEDEKAKVVYWLYPKREGGAAAVYFRMSNNKVYNTKFDAVKAQVVKE
jgi:hypothetical protein